MKMEPQPTRGRLAEGKIASVTAKIRDLKKMLRVLSEIRDTCDGCRTTDECPILNALDGRPAQGKTS